MRYSLSGPRNTRCRACPKLARPPSSPYLHPSSSPTIHRHSRPHLNRPLPYPIFTVENRKRPRPRRSLRRHLIRRRRQHPPHHLVIVGIDHTQRPIRVEGIARPWYERRTLRGRLPCGRPPCEVLLADG